MTPDSRSTAVSELSAVDQLRGCLLPRVLHLISFASAGVADDELVEDWLAGRRHPVLEPRSFHHCKTSAGHQPLDGGAEPVRIRLVHPPLIDREGHRSAGSQGRECIFERLWCGVRAAERSGRHQPPSTYGRSASRSASSRKKSPTT